MHQIIASKVAQASAIADGVGKASAAGGAGVAFFDWAGWITQHATLIGLVIAAAGYFTSQILSWWFKSRLLKIAEVHGVNVVTGDE